MIEAVWAHDRALFAVMVALAVAVAAPVWVAAGRRGAPRVLWVGASTAVVVAVVATMYPVNRGATAPMVCTVQRDLVGPVLAEQGTLNVALFVPAGLALALAVGRPVLVLAGLALLSGTVELAQGLTPGIGRSCDSADLEANVLGAATGCALAVLIRMYRRRSAWAGAAEVRRSAVVLVVGGALLGTVAASTLLVVAVDAADHSVVSGSQKAAAERAVHEFFGGSAHALNVKYLPGADGQPGVISFGTPGGFLTVAWPSGEVTSGLVGPVVPVGRAAASDEVLIGASRSFARAHFPWALVDSAPRVVDTESGGGAKAVEWRSRVDGVLMPMRYSTVVGADGAVMSFSARRVEPPALAKPVVTEEQARRAALAGHPGAEVTSADLLAQKDRAGVWHARWLLSLRTPAEDGRTVVAASVVDASDGSVVTGDRIVPDGS